MWYKTRGSTIIEKPIAIENSKLNVWFRNPATPKYGDVWVSPKFPAGLCLIIGHRGSSELYPENTMLAFQKAREGAKGFEFDVRKTVDGEFVIMHDASVDRTTNGTGLVAELTYDYISTLDAGSWKGAEFANREDCKVPTFAEILDNYKNTDMFLSVNIATSDIETSRLIVDEIRNRNMLHQCLIFWGRTDKLGQLRTYDPNVFLMNAGTSNDPSTILQTAISEKWDAISAAPELWTTTITEQAKSNRVLTQISALTNNYQANMNLAVSLGVNIVLGDNCAEMLNYVSVEQITPFKNLEVFVRGENNWNGSNISN